MANQSEPIPFKMHGASYRLAGKVQSASLRLNEGRTLVELGLLTRIDNPGRLNPNDESIGGPPEQEGLASRTALGEPPPGVQLPPPRFVQRETEPGVTVPFPVFPPAPRIQPACLPVDGLFFGDDSVAANGIFSYRYTFAGAGAAARGFYFAQRVTFRVGTFDIVGGREQLVANMEVEYHEVFRLSLAAGGGVGGRAGDDHVLDLPALLRNVAEMRPRERRSIIRVAMNLQIFESVAPNLPLPFNRVGPPAPADTWGFDYLLSFPGPGAGSPQGRVFAPVRREVRRFSLAELERFFGFNRRTRFTASGVRGGPIACRRIQHAFSATVTQSEPGTFEVQIEAIPPQVNYE